MRKTKAAGEAAPHKKGLLLAWKAMKKSYAPYSQFRVGCALQLMSGAYITGCNVENVSFGAAICAERTAVVKAVSEIGAGLIGKIKTVYLCNSSKRACMPCGLCLQVLAEFASAGDLEIVSRSADGRHVAIYQFKDIFPEVFDQSFLKTKKKR